MKLFKLVSELYLRFRYKGSNYARKRGVIVGENCRVYTKNFGSEPWLITIGNNVTLTSGVKLLTHDGSTWLFRDALGRRYLYKRVRIGNYVFVGVNSIIMPGVVIEDFVIVGAGSVVTKSIPSGSIVAGNPAVIIGNYHDFEKKALDNFINDSMLDLNKPYMQRILEVVDNSIKKYM